MITRLVIENFKGFQRVDLRLGRFNLLVGTNASGKSNLLDALRVLQGLGNGLTVQETLNGKPKSARQDVWPGIRGGAEFARFQERANGKTRAGRGLIRFEIEMASETINGLHYGVSFDPVSGLIEREDLTRDDRLLVTTGDVQFKGRKPERMRPNNPGEMTPETVCSTSLAFSLFGTIPAKNDLPFNAEIDLCLDSLTNFQFLEPQLVHLRAYASPQPVVRMGDRGENFAGLIKTICQRPKQRAAFVGWLRELSPLELDDVAVLSGAVGEPLFALREGGREFPAHILSDGTLRFAALAAAFFQPEPPGVLCLEEIENAIHPTRLRVLVELLKQFSRRGRPQVMATSHSPVVLSWLRAEDYPSAFLCRRRPEDGASDVRPLPSLPNFARLVELQQLDEFFVEGGMEAAL
ncbi:MAG: DUF2813 domain-containing protein [Verrucomicrobia bacterium]|nr:DUF2813 domain-containing protein [Verrucomicrobiota bacterium]